MTVHSTIKSYQLYFTIPNCYYTSTSVTPASRSRCRICLSSFQHPKRPSPAPLYQLSLLSNPQLVTGGPAHASPFVCSARSSGLGSLNKSLPWQRQAVNRTPSPLRCRGKGHAVKPPLHEALRGRARRAQPATQRFSAAREEDPNCSSRL